MAAPGKTSCAASVCHKYKLTCKYHSGHQEVFEQIFPVSSLPWAPHGRGEVMLSLLPPARGRWNTTTGKNYKWLRAALKANCPLNEGSSKQGLCSAMCCGRLVNPAVWQQNRILFQVFWSTTMTDTNAPAGRKPTINQDSLEFGGNFSRTRNAEVSVSPEHSSRTKIYYLI